MAVGTATRTLATRSTLANAARIRKTLTPGAVGILLQGRYTGRRVVVLKVLNCGYIAVTGPYEINHVPLLKVHQHYLIGTSTHLNISGVDTSKIDEALFKKSIKKASGKSPNSVRGESSRSEALLSVQKEVDKALAISVKKEPLMSQYLKTHFSLGHTGGLYPHELKF